MFGFHNCNKEGLNQKWWLLQKHTERCARRTEWYRGGGDWHVFKIAPPKKSRQPLAKNLLIQLKNCFFLKDLFSETVRQSCCSDECWMLEVWLVHSWLCCKACNELWASLRLINTLVVLSVLLLNLENLFFFIYPSIHSLNHLSNCCYGRSAACLSYRSL